VTAPFDIEAADAAPAPLPARGRRGRWWKILLAIVAAGLVVVLVAGFWVYRKIDPAGGPGAAVTIDIPNGSSTKRIADLLAAADVVADARVFQIYTKIDGSGPWQAGTYSFRKNSSMDDAVAASWSAWCMRWTRSSSSSASPTRRPGSASRRTNSSSWRR
jgi:YceG-like Ter operon protein